MGGRACYGTPVHDPVVDKQQASESGGEWAKQ